METVEKLSQLNTVEIVKTALSFTKIKSNRVVQLVKNIVDKPSYDANISDLKKELGEHFDRLQDVFSFEESPVTTGISKVSSDQQQQQGAWHTEMLNEFEQTRKEHEVSARAYVCPRRCSLLHKIRKMLHKLKN